MSFNTRLLKRLNPFNHLAGKIFMGFWLLFVLTVLTLLLILHHIEPQAIEKPVPHHAFNLIRSLEEHAMRMHRRDGDISFERVLNSPRIGRNHLFVYYDQSGQVASSKPLPPEFDTTKLDADSPEPITHIQGDIIAYGPFTMLTEDNAYRVFSLYPYRTHPISRFKQLPPWLRLGLPIVISAFLSYFIATSLVNPIRQLRNAHRSLAEGDLETRSNGVALRNDELGQLGRDFDHMAVKISGLLAAQKRLLGDVSHELRSPLARLQIALGLAQQPQTTDLQRHLQRIELEANRLDDMIGDVLRLSRLETQLQNIEKYPLSLKSLLEILIKDANFEARDANREVQFECLQDALAAGDQALLASAFENVIRNGVKYTEEKTAVQVRLEVIQDQAVITIRDFGPGVPTSALSQLFEPFYRVSDSRQRSSGGTGLGLAIAEKSVRSHGGTITAHNHQEKGLEIAITLPLAKESGKLSARAI